MKAIDIWCNPFTPEIMKVLTKPVEMANVIEWWHAWDRYKGRTVEQFVGDLDEAGFDKVLIPAWQMKSYQFKTMLWEVSLKDTAELVNKRPDKFFGLYGINPEKRMDGVRELQKAIKEYGFKGAHLHTYGFDRPLNHRDYWPFYAKCEELGVPVQMQVGHSAEMMPSALAQPIQLDDIALYFPGLKIIGAHTGWPWVEEMIAVAWKHPNVFIGTSAHSPKYWDKSLVAFMNSRGKGKVMFATDYPVVMHKDAMRQIDELGLKDDAKAQLLREAAVKVYKLE